LNVGKSARHALGRFEPVAIKLYRNRFIDVDALAVSISAAAPGSKRVLEIGCGDGAVAAAIRHTQPSSELLGIDPGAARPGAFYDAAREGAQFRAISTRQLLAESPQPFDLVVVCDVLHHVADPDRRPLLLDAAALTAPGGTLAVKEWERIRGAGFYPAYLTDRWISGDKTVRYMPRAELAGLVEDATPGWETTCEARIPPRRANLLLTRRRPA
jgi:2-polyprenyl-6-hydroxyphenyl methylase/3-demethylubiquinone-9 3-methyltransferase